MIQYDAIRVLLDPLHLSLGKSFDYFLELFIAQAVESHQSQPGHLAFIKHGSGLGAPLGRFLN